MLLRQPSHASVVRALQHNENKAVIADIVFGRGWRATGPGLPVVVSIEEAFTMRFRLRRSCRNERP